jgi:hypothetical protein
MTTKNYNEINEITLDSGTVITRQEFKTYVDVQREGLYNMIGSDAMMAVGFDPRDREDKSRYRDLLSNYMELANGFGINV